jgi:hypothetical protein
MKINTFIFIFTFNSFFTTLFLSSSTLSFKTTGHFIVARIAEKEIEHLSFYPELMKLLSIVGSFSKDDKYPFIESASWADDIKYIDWDWMDKWHFDNIYIDGKRIIPKKDYHDLGLSPAKQDVVWAINEMKRTLRNTKISLVDDHLGKSISLRMLIHLVGDIHQPLHASTLVNKDFPRGDSGGNAFEIDMPGTRDLHSYWDACLKKYPIMKHPLSERQFRSIDSIAQDIMDHYPRGMKSIEKRLKKTSVRDWAYESVKLSLKYAYKGIKPGEKPSKQYIQNGQKIIDEQLAMAGYRLADILIDLFSDPQVLQLHIKGESPKPMKRYILETGHSNSDELSSNESDHDLAITSKVVSLLSHNSRSTNSQFIHYFVSVCITMLLIIK